VLQWILVIASLSFAAVQSSRSFLPDTSLIANPERGWYIQEQNTVATNWLASERTLYGSTLLRLYIRLDPWKNGGTISDSALQSMQQTFDRVQAQGYKVILRFAYNFGNAADAPLSVIEDHLHQLRPFLQKNADLIWTVEAGLVGYWGEWHSSENGLTYVWDDPQIVKQTALDARNRIVDSLLAILPEGKSVLIRYPQAISELLENQWPNLDASSAFTPTRQARLGHHNDCFLASIDDWGTYTCTDWQDTACFEASPHEVSWFQNNSRWFPVEGETCNNDPMYSACDTALKYLQQNHWDALHRHYDETVINRWKTEGCYGEVQRNVGYRFEVVEVKWSDTVGQGGTVLAQILLRNTGFGKLYNAHPIRMSLRNPENHTINANGWNDTGLVDMRRLGPGDSMWVEGSFAIPLGTPVGNYQLDVWMPDISERLASDARYSIRFATKNLWNATRGVNEFPVNIWISSQLASTIQTRKQDSIIDFLCPVLNQYRLDGRRIEGKVHK